MFENDANSSPSQNDEHGNSSTEYPGGAPRKRARRATRSSACICIWRRSSARSTAKAPPSTKRRSRA